MAPLEKWMHSIAQRTNDAALLFVMFNDDERYKAVLYSYLIQHQRELMAQFVSERSVRAHCHLIKRACIQGKNQKALHYASSLNELLATYAESLLLMVKDGNDAIPRCMH